MPENTLMEFVRENSGKVDPTVIVDALNYVDEDSYRDEIFTLVYPRINQLPDPVLAFFFQKVLAYKPALLP